MATFNVFADAVTSDDVWADAFGTVFFGEIVSAAEPPGVEPADFFSVDHRPPFWRPDERGTTWRPERRPTFWSFAPRGGSAE